MRANSIHPQKKRFWRRQPHISRQAWNEPRRRAQLENDARALAWGARRGEARQGPVQQQSARYPFAIHFFRLPVLFAWYSYARHLALLAHRTFVCLISQWWCFYWPIIRDDHTTRSRVLPQIPAVSSSENSSRVTTSRRLRTQHLSLLLATYTQLTTGAASLCFSLTRSLFPRPFLCSFSSILTRDVLLLSCGRPLIQFSFV